MKKHRDQIKAKLGIDWTMVKWTDLEKPLFSALAARLYLARLKEAIPSDVPCQAKYWKKHYNTVNGSGTVEKFINDVKQGKGCAN